MTLLVVVVFVLGVGTASSAQTTSLTLSPERPQQVTPARDGTPTVHGTAAIKGQVIDAHTGAPVRRAVVAASAGSQRRTAVSDADGRFELRDLAAGRHYLTGSKSGYLADVVFRRIAPPLVVEVADRQTADNVTVRMWRGGVISGRVLDEFGDPVIGIEVQPLQLQYAGGRRQLVAAGTGMGSARTDDLGAFRLYGLPPGTYYVSARPMLWEQINRDTPPDGAGAVPTFYPGTGDPSQAQRITVTAGKETGGVHVTLLSGRLARVRGFAFRANGEPLAGRAVTVQQRFFNTSIGTSGGSVAADGSFEVRGLAPGTYSLRVRPAQMRDEPAAEIAAATVTVTGDDLEGVLLASVRAGVARGRIVTDDGGPPPGREQMWVGARPIDADADDDSPRLELRDDLSFEVTGIIGRQRLIASGGRGPWVLKSVSWDGQDITDEGLDFSGRTIDGITITMTRTVTRLSGVVTDQTGAPADGWLVLFPADETKWRPESRYIRAMRAGQQGELLFTGMPPYHDYLLAAVPDLEQGQWEDPALLRTLRDRAVAVSLAEGEHKVQNLRLQR